MGAEPSDQGALFGARIDRHLAAVLDAFPDGLLLFDADDRLQMVSASIQSTYGPGAGSVRLGRSFEDMAR